MSAAIDDRAAGAVLGTAAGDALGAGYEFGPALPDGTEVSMIGGGPFDWEPGEWTDDTSMAIPLLEVAARGGVFNDQDLDVVAGRWLEWSVDAKDVGNQTRAALDAARQVGTAEALRSAAREQARRTGRSGGNGSLMRTAPLALAFLHDEGELVVAARRVSELTHADPDAGDACVLWCCAIRHAVLTGELDLRRGLRHVREPRRSIWSDWIAAAKRMQPRDIQQSGWVVGALQAAWSAITNGSRPVDVLERAVRGGGDTDTVAAIAGGLIGAVHGASAFPARWTLEVHGWPGLRSDDLTALAVAAAAASLGRVAPTPERGLLEAVRILHDRGYEALRARFVFGGAGYWRCVLSVDAGGAQRDLLRYSNAAGWDVLSDGRGEPVPSSALADRLERLEGLDAAQHPDPAYRFWFAALLEHCGPDRLPSLDDDWSHPELEGRVALTGAGGSGRLADSFPLPPGQHRPS
ncbi:ADP-ribosylglycohydrolase family protein [Amnibacterium kyonggiense]|uniref:ADP-ribosylglycohydrolase n=1 Tax=Amnibacterium kyonggiense TaxID=595671 RepID=A0A4R7FLH6_9MICO|nr:ADP-ribosylglycohydrolase family protein [Amnibacterium kyonggiense]TDS77255.1 ADP-ribosylglycohydrolase [Amnibacterium kyonggiense]